MIEHIPYLDINEELSILYGMAAISKKDRDENSERLRKRFEGVNFSEKGAAVMNFFLNYTEDAGVGKELLKEIEKKTEEERAREKND